MVVDSRDTHTLKYYSVWPVVRVHCFLLQAMRPEAMFEGPHMIAYEIQGSRGQWSAIADAH